MKFEIFTNWNFRSDKILEIVTIFDLLISGSEERVFWFSSVFGCRSQVCGRSWAWR